MKDGATPALFNNLLQSIDNLMADLDAIAEFMDYRELFLIGGTQKLLKTVRENVLWLKLQCEGDQHAKRADNSK